MSFHSSALFVAIANVANTNVPPIQDGIIAISNAHLLPQRDYDIVYAHIAAVTLVRARMVSPTNRQITLPFIRPIQAALLPPTNPNVCDFRDNPFRINALEEFSIEGTDSAAGPNNCTAIVGLSESFEPVPRGNIFTLRGTSVTAAVANTWTQLVTTWDDALPAGQYAVVGMTAFATNQLAARLIFENQVVRPGSVGQVAEANRNHDMFRKGGLGTWGRFMSTRMPVVEVLNNGTDAAHTIYLDIVRLR